jgi:hypothetical protein
MSLLLRAHTNQLLALPKAEREQLVEGWRAKRLAEEAARKAEADAKQAKLREQYGDWADDPDFFEF